jgi:hypothetical protein
MKTSIERITSKKKLKKLYTFFKQFKEHDIPKFPAYMKYALNMGESYALLDDKDKIIGGLVLYNIIDHNCILNYYVPPKLRPTPVHLRLFVKIFTFIEKYPVDTYIESPDVSLYEKYVTHVENNTWKFKHQDEMRIAYIKYQYREKDK